MTKRLINLLALLLLGIFFLPFILKLRELDLLVLLIGGLVLPVYDYFTSKDDQ